MWTTNSRQEEGKTKSCVRANKMVRLDWNVSRSSLCETLHCRGRWLLVAGPDKSLRSLMFVTDRDWVHNRLEAGGHDIHLLAICLSNTVRVIASVTPPQPSEQRHISQSSHTPSFLFATAPHAWEMFSKSKVQYWQKVLCQMPAVGLF